MSPGRGLSASIAHTITPAWTLMLQCENAYGRDRPSLMQPANTVLRADTELLEIATTASASAVTAHRP
jgi:hypothetical protein